MLNGICANAWFPPSPIVALGALIGASVLAAIVDNASRRQRKRALRELAARWGMTYSPHDNLRVAQKIAHRLPVPGAADVYVTDVIYGTRGDAYQYVFTTEYTLGAVRGKRRHVRVGSLLESRGKEPPAHAGEVVLAPEGLALVEQYEKVSSAKVRPTG